MTDRITPPRLAPVPDIMSPFEMLFEYEILALSVNHLYNSDSTEERKLKRLNAVVFIIPVSSV